MFRLTTPDDPVPGHECIDVEDVEIEDTTTQYQLTPSLWKRRNHAFFKCHRSLIQSEKDIARDLIAALTVSLNNRPDLSSEGEKRYDQMMLIGCTIMFILCLSVYFNDDNNKTSVALSDFSFSIVLLLLCLILNRTTSHWDATFQQSPINEKSAKKINAILRESNLLKALLSNITLEGVTVETYKNRVQFSLAKLSLLASTLENRVTVDTYYEGTVKIKDQFRVKMDPPLNKEDQNYITAMIGAWATQDPKHIHFWENKESIVETHFTFQHRS